MKNRLLNIVFCLLSFSIFGQISTSERQALQNLYTATNGDQWNNSWDINQPASEWEGVTIKDNKVISISLLFNNMEGELPSSIDQLKYLEVLELSFNKLKGSIPIKLGNLKNLKVLAFNGNDLSGTIPASLGNLTNLIQMHLSSNKLTGELPETIANLDDLEVLNVFDNDLSGNIPSEFAYFKNLKQLMIAENNFTATDEFSTLLLSNGASVDFNDNPFIVPENKDVIAIETEEEN